jgi:hypothetical protein
MVKKKTEKFEKLPPSLMKLLHSGTYGKRALTIGKKLL